jgi:predicted nucleic acid-binding protein
VSRLRRDGPYDRLLVDRVQSGEPVAITAPTVMEVARGLQATALSDQRFAAALDWWVRTIHSDLVEVIAFDEHAAVVAGRLRARHPTGPGQRRKGRSKPDARAGWVLDLQIAACAWVAGRAVATDNGADFAHIAAALARLYPDVPALEVLESPL